MSRVDAQLGELPEIPAGWCWTTLGEVAEIKLGKMLSKKAFADELLQLPYLRNQNVRWFTIDLSDLKSMGFKETELERYKVAPNDLLICEGGEPGRCAVYKGGPSPMMYQKALHRLRPFDRLDPHFIQYFFFRYISDSSVFPRKAETTIKHLPLEKILKIPFSLPPLAEQNRIVTKVEELFSDLDAGVAALERARANLKRYRAALLKAAVEGRLTEQWRRQNPPAEPASQLLQRILEQRRQKWEEDQSAKYEAKGKKPPKNWREKYKEPAAPDSRNLPELPRGWCWATPAQLASPEPYSLGIGPFGSNLKVSDYTDVGVPLVFVRNIRSRHFGGLDTKYVSEGKAKDLAAHTTRPGDVLITKMGDPPGDACIYPAGQPPAIITSDCIKLRASCLMPSSDYLKAVIKSQIVQSQILSITRGVAQKKISLSRFSKISLPLAPVGEQERMIEIIEEGFALVDVAESQAGISLLRASRLRQSILKEAFQGRLVAQDTNDEPADVLLGRIRDQHSVQPKRTRKSKSRQLSIPFQEPA